jgi:hypothetical protein
MTTSWCYKFSYVFPKVVIERIDLGLMQSPLHLILRNGRIELVERIWMKGSVWAGRRWLFGGNSGADVGYWVQGTTTDGSRSSFD